MNNTERQASWPLLACCTFGLSTASVATYALGQFLLPLEHEFGWSRTQASAGLSISLVLGFLTAPLVGRLIDKINARTLALPGLLLLACAVAAFSLTTSSLLVWSGLWMAHALAGALVGPTVWLAVVTGAFTRNRSLAIAVALCGTNLSATIVPATTRVLIDTFGWRIAFQLLALVWVGGALLVSVFLFRDTRQRRNQADAHQVSAKPSEVPLRTVFLSPTFIRLALAVTVTTIVGSAYAIHLAPALSSKGLSLVEAATVAGVMGIAAIPGKLGTGWIVDRLGPGNAAILIMSVFAVAAALFALPSDKLSLAILACALLGTTTGANITLITIMTSKAFSQDVFGVVYGTIVSLTALGAAIGPVVISAVFDSFGSYSPAFWAGMPVAIVAALLLQNLKSSTHVPIHAAAH